MRSYIPKVVFLKGEAGAGAEAIGHHTEEFATGLALLGKHGLGILGIGGIAHTVLDANGLGDFIDVLIGSNVGEGPAHLLEFADKERMLSLFQRVDAFS